jgi:large subunit ribosomal protein L25
VGERRSQEDDMEEIVLSAQAREVIGKHVATLRRKGKLPAVIYGRGFDPRPIVMDYREVTRILPGVSSSHLITLDVDGEKYMTLVREKQHDPVNGSLLHVDFQKVSLTEKIRVMISIELVGEASAVKNFNGVVVTGVEELDVECFPQDLPERIIVDISKLEAIGNAIYVRDISLPPQIEVFTEPHELIVVITAQEAEEEEVVVEAPEVITSEPEVIERGKKEEEEF